MFGNNKKTDSTPSATTNKPNRIDTLISQKTKIKGNINFVGGLRIEGEVEGDIKLDNGSEPGMLMVGPKAVVTGNISVTHLTVDGIINGDIHASHTLEVSSTAKIIGDVHYSNIKLQLGGVIQGNLINSEKAPETKNKKDEKSDSSK